LSYDAVILIQTIYPLEDSYDFEGMRDGGEAHEKNIGKAYDYIKSVKDSSINYDKIKILGAGGCSICPKCGIIENVPCRFPDRAVSSVEGYCMNVANMAESHGLKYINGENTVSYVAVFLLKQ
jgi:predicted metal-binding protein